MKNEFEYYDKISNWDFSMIKCKEECLTNWNMYDLLKKYATKNSKILDLGTGAGEQVIRNFPRAKEIIATDFSPAMIDNAKKNLKKSGRKDIKFDIMNNLDMTTPDNYFDIVVARNTCIDAKQVYKTLKPGGKFIIRGVDKLDCWELKRLFNCGQAYYDTKPISQIDYESVLDANFKNVELVPLHVREYYETKEDLLALLYKVPILRNFSEEKNNKNLDDVKLDFDLIDKYISENTYDKGILLIRRYYGITATK